MDASKIMKSFGGMEVYDEAARHFITGVVTAGTGAAYTVNVKGVESLTSGMRINMVPHVNSTTTTPTLDVNGLGAKQIRQRISSSASATTSLVSKNMIIKDKPMVVVYDGTNWIIETPIADAESLYGVVPIDKGGLGADLSTEVGKVPYTTSGYVKFADWTKGALYPDTGGSNGVELISGALPVKYGGTGGADAKTALNNLGITWGTGEAPSTGAPNSIYIQIN